MIGLRRDGLVKRRPLANRLAGQLFFDLAGAFTADSVNNVIGRLDAASHGIADGANGNRAGTDVLSSMSPVPPGT